MALININPRLTAEENFRAILIDKGLTPGQAQGIINTFTNIVPVEPSEAAVWKESNTSADGTLIIDGVDNTGKIYWKRVEPLPAWVDNLILKVPQSAGATVDTLLAAILTSHESIGLVKDFEVSDATIVRPTSVEDALSNGIVINAQANSKVYVGSDVLKVIASFAGIVIVDDVFFNITGKPDAGGDNRTHTLLPPNNANNQTLIVALARASLIKNNYSVTTFSSDDVKSPVSVEADPSGDPSRVVFNVEFDATSEYQGTMTLNYTKVQMAEVSGRCVDDLVFKRNTDNSVNIGDLIIMLTPEQKSDIRNDITNIGTVVTTALINKLGEDIFSYLTMTPHATIENTLVLKSENVNFFSGEFNITYDLTEVITMPLMLNGFGETLVLEDLSGFDVA